MTHRISDIVVMVKGGGEVATAVGHRLAQSHFKVCLTEKANPLAVNRGVAFSEAVYDGEKEVEGVVAKLITSAEEVLPTWGENKLPIIVDPQASIEHLLHPEVIVDATMAKKNLDTNIGDATLVIGLGPGFKVGKDVHVVVETNNTENLGRVILTGEAEANTGIPQSIGGLTKERVLYPPGKGLFHSVREIGDMVSAGDVVAWVGNYPIKAQIDGVLRALLRDGIEVNKETKLGEIDQRGDRQLCYTIRARMRAIAGGVLEAILLWFNA
ncbi:selenium-dependent molybdenum cofactor biosynthesis protein YqeB [Chloroflexota bacterium]